MQDAFAKASYRAQVHRLGKLARVVLQSYAIKARQIVFINHGENTTFKVHGSDNQLYLLRIHRAFYHSRMAILEEHRWLLKLSRQERYRFPLPVKSKKGHTLEEVVEQGLDAPRFCDLLVWVDGRFLTKSLHARHFEQVGAMIGFLHKQSSKLCVKHRCYWDLDGLLGPNPKFGPTNALSGIDKTQQAFLNRSRQAVYRKISGYHKRHSDRMGLIHADLHFRNMLFDNGEVGAIDFDDCGYGFHLYDLAVPAVVADGFAIQSKYLDSAEAHQALYQGYRQFMELTTSDEQMILWFKAARTITMLGWLQSRSDNPRLKRLMPQRVRNAIKFLRKNGF